MAEQHAPVNPPQGSLEATEPPAAIQQQTEAPSDKPSDAATAAAAHPSLKDVANAPSGTPPVAEAGTVNIPPPAVTPSGDQETHVSATTSPTTGAGLPASPIASDTITAPSPSVGVGNQGSFEQDKEKLVSAASDGLDAAKGADLPRRFKVLYDGFAALTAEQLADNWHWWLKTLFIGQRAMFDASWGSVTPQPEWLNWALKFSVRLRDAALIGLQRPSQEDMAELLEPSKWSAINGYRLAAKEKQTEDLKEALHFMAQLVTLASEKNATDMEWRIRKNLHKAAPGELPWRCSACLALLPLDSFYMWFNQLVTTPGATTPPLGQAGKPILVELFDLFGDSLVERICKRLQQSNDRRTNFETLLNDGRPKPSVWCAWMCKISLYLNLPEPDGVVPRCVMPNLPMEMLVNHNAAIRRLLLSNVAGIMPLKWVVTRLKRESGAKDLSQEFIGHLSFVKILESELRYAVQEEEGKAKNSENAELLQTVVDAYQEILQQLLHSVRTNGPACNNRGELPSPYRDALQLLASNNLLKPSDLGLFFRAITKPLALNALARLLISCSTFLGCFDDAVRDGSFVTEFKTVLKFVDASSGSEALADHERTHGFTLPLAYSAAFKTIVDADSQAMTANEKMMRLGKRFIISEIPVDKRASVLLRYAAHRFRAVLIVQLQALATKDAQSLPGDLVKYVRATMIDSEAVTDLPQLRTAAKSLWTRNLQLVRKSGLEALSASRNILCVLGELLDNAPPSSDNDEDTANAKLGDVPNYSKVLAAIQTLTETHERRSETAMWLYEKLETSSKLPQLDANPSLDIVESALTALDRAVLKAPLVVTGAVLDEVAALRKHTGELYNRLFRLVNGKPIAAKLKEVRAHLVSLVEAKASSDLIRALLPYFNEVDMNHFCEMLRGLPPFLSPGAEPMTEKAVFTVRQGVSDMTRYLDLLVVGIRFVQFVQSRWQVEEDGGLIADLKKALEPFAPRRLDTSYTSSLDKLLSSSVFRSALSSVPVDQVSSKSARLAELLFPALSHEGLTTSMLADEPSKKLLEYLNAVWTADDLVRFFVNYKQFTDLLQIIRDNTERDGCHADVLTLSENARALLLPIVDAPELNETLSAERLAVLHRQVLLELARWRTEIVRDVLEAAKQNHGLIETLFAQADVPTTQSELPLVQCVLLTGTLVSCVEPPAWHIEYFHGDPWHTKLKELLQLLLHAAPPSADDLSACIGDLLKHRRVEAGLLRRVLTKHGWSEGNVTNCLAKRVDLVKALRKRVVPRLTGQQALERMQGVNMFIEREGREEAFNLFEDLLRDITAYHRVRRDLFEHGMLFDSADLGNPLARITRLPPGQHSELRHLTSELEALSVSWKEALLNAATASPALHLLSYAQLRQLMAALKGFNGDLTKLRQCVRPWLRLSCLAEGLTEPEKDVLDRVNQIPETEKFRPLLVAAAVISSSWLNADAPDPRGLRVLRRDVISHRGVLRVARHLNNDADPHPAQLLYCAPDTSVPDLEQFLARAKAIMRPFFVVNPERLSPECRNSLQEWLRRRPTADLLLLVKSNSVANEFAFLRNEEITPPELRVAPVQNFHRLLGDARIGKTTFIKSLPSSPERFVMTEGFSPEHFTKTFGERIATSTLRGSPAFAVHFDVSPYADPTRCELFFRNLIRWQLVLHSDGTAVSVPNNAITGFVELSEPLSEAKQAAHTTAKAFYDDAMPSVMLFPTELKADFTFMPERSHATTLSNALVGTGRARSAQASVAEHATAFLASSLAPDWSAWSPFQKQLALALAAARYEWFRTLYNDVKNAARLVRDNPGLKRVAQADTTAVERFLLGEIKALVRADTIDFCHPPALGTRVINVPNGEHGICFATLSVYDVGGKFNSPSLSVEHNFDKLSCRQWLSGVLEKESYNHFADLLEQRAYVMTADYAFKLALLYEYQKHRSSVVLCGDTGVGKTELLRIFALLVNQRHVPNILSIIAGCFSPEFRKKWTPQELQGKSEAEGGIHLITIDGLMRGIAEWLRRNNANLIEVATDITNNLLTALDVLHNCPILDIRSGDPLRGKASELTASFAKQPKCELIISKLQEFVKAILALPVRPLFMPLLIHRNWTVKEFKKAVRKAEAEARELDRLLPNGGAKYVVLVDEWNTGSDTLGVIREVLTDHTLDGKPLPRSLFWVAANNPHGAYNVRTLHASLAELQLQYGRLSLNQERLFIDELLSHHAYIAEDVEGADPLTERLAALKAAIECGQRQLHEAQGNAKKGEPQANIHMSVRDILRAKDMYEYFFKDQGGRAIVAAAFASGDVTTMTRHWIALIGAMYLAYVARLDPVRCAKYREALHDHINKAIMERIPLREAFRNLLGAQAFTSGVNVCSMVEEALFKGLWLQSDVPAGVAATPAIMRNLFSVVTIADTRHGLLIVGPPGAGKTLSFTIAGSKMKSPPEKLYKNLHVMAPFRYQCTPHSTDKEIAAQYDQARRAQRAFLNTKPPQHCVVLLDEAGLPREENAALKVLHYHLDDRSNERVASLLLSNRVLDPAKTNRLFVLFNHNDVTESTQLSELVSGVLFDVPKARLKLDTHVKIVTGLCTSLESINSEERLRLSVCRLRFEQRDIVSFLRYLRYICTRDDVHGAPKLTSERVLLAMEYVFSAVGPEAFAFMVRNVLDALHMKQVPVYDNTEQRLLAVLRAHLTESDNVNLACERYVMLLDDTDTEASLEVFRQLLAEAEKGVRAPFDADKQQLQKQIKELAERIAACSPEADQAKLQSELEDVKQQLVVLDGKCTQAVSAFKFASMRVSDFADDTSEAVLAGHIRDLKHRLREDGCTVLINPLPVSTSFYDVINRHFRAFVVDGKKRFYARVAVGAHSRECGVNPNFKLVVHVPMSRLAEFPAPFLDRFQKFRLSPAQRLQSVIGRSLSTVLADSDEAKLFNAIADVQSEAVRMIGCAASTEAPLFYGVTLPSKESPASLQHHHASASLLLHYLETRDDKQLQPLSSRIMPTPFARETMRSEMLRCVNRKLLQLARPEFLFFTNTLPKAYHEEYLDNQPHFSFCRLLELLQQPNRPRRVVLFVRASADALSELDSLGSELLGMKVQCIELARCRSYSELCDKLKKNDDGGNTLSRVCISDMSLCTQLQLNTLHELVATRASSQLFLNMVLVPVAIMTASPAVTHAVFLRGFDYFYLDALDLRPQTSWRKVLLEPAQWLSVAMGLRPTLSKAEVEDSFDKLLLEAVREQVEKRLNVASIGKETFSFRRANIEPLPGTQMGVVVTAKGLAQPTEKPLKLKRFAANIWRGSINYNARKMKNKPINCVVVTLKANGEALSEYDSTVECLYPDAFTCAEDEKDAARVLVKFLQQNPGLYRDVLHDLIDVWTGSLLADKVTEISKGVQAAGKHSFAAELQDSIAVMIENTAFYMATVLCSEMQLPLVRKAIKGESKPRIEIVARLLRAHQPGLTLLPEEACITVGLPSPSVDCTRLVGFPTLHRALSLLADQAFRVTQHSGGEGAGGHQQKFELEFADLLADNKHIGEAVALVNSDSELQGEFFEDFVTRELCVPLFSVPPYTEFVMKLVKHLTPMLREENFVERLYSVQRFGLETGPLSLRNVVTYFSPLRELESSPELEFDQHAPPGLLAEQLAFNLWRPFDAPPRGTYAQGWCAAFRAMCSRFPDMLTDHRGLSPLSETKMLTMFIAFETLAHFDGTKEVLTDTAPLLDLLKKSGFARVIAFLNEPANASSSKNRNGPERWRMLFELVESICKLYEAPEFSARRLAFLETILPRLLPNDLSVLLSLCHPNLFASLSPTLRSLPWQWRVRQFCQFMNGPRRDELFTLAEAQLPPVDASKGRTFLPPCVPTQVPKVASHLTLPAPKPAECNLANVLFVAFSEEQQAFAQRNGINDTYRRLAKRREEKLTTYCHEIDLAALECVAMKLAAEQLNRQSPGSTGDPNSPVKVLVRQWTNDGVLPLLSRLWSEPHLRLLFIANASPLQLRELLQEISVGPFHVSQHSDVGHVFTQYRYTLAPASEGGAAARYQALKQAIANGAPALQNAIQTNAIAAGGELAADLLLVCFYEYYSQNQAAPSFINGQLANAASPLCAHLGGLRDKELALLREFSQQPRAPLTDAQEDHLTNVFAHPSADKRLATVLINVLAAMLAVRHETFLHRVAYSPLTVGFYANLNCFIPGGRYLIDCNYKVDGMSWGALTPACMGNVLRHRYALAVMVWSAVVWALKTEPRSVGHFTEQSTSHLLNAWNEDHLLKHAGVTREAKARSYVARRVQALYACLDTECTNVSAGVFFAAALDELRVYGANGSLGACASMPDAIAREQQLQEHVFWPAERKCGSAAHMKPYGEVAALAAPQFQEVLQLQAAARGRALPLATWDDVLPMLNPQGGVGTLVANVHGYLPSLVRTEAVQTLVAFYVTMSRVLTRMLPGKAFYEWPLSSPKEGVKTVLSHLREANSTKADELRRLLKRFLESWGTLLQAINVFAVCGGGGGGGDVARAQRHVEELSEDASLALLLSVPAPQQKEVSDDSDYILRFVDGFLSRVQTPLISAGMELLKDYPLRCASLVVSEADASPVSLYDLLSTNNTHILVGSGFSEAEFQHLVLSHTRITNKGVVECDWRTVEAQLLARVISGRTMLAVNTIRAILEEKPEETTAVKASNGIAQSLSVALDTLPLAFSKAQDTEGVTNVLFAQVPRLARVWDTVAVVRRICIAARQQNPAWSDGVTTALAIPASDTEGYRKALTDLLALRDLRAFLLREKLRGTGVISRESGEVMLEQLSDRASCTNALTLLKGDLTVDHLNDVTFSRLAAWAGEELASTLLDAPVVLSAPVSLLRVIGVALRDLTLELELGAGEVALGARDYVRPLMGAFVTDAQLVLDDETKQNAQKMTALRNTWLPLLLDLLNVLYTPAVKEKVLREPEQLIAEVLPEKLRNSHPAIKKLFDNTLRCKHLPAIVSRLHATTRDLFLSQGAHSTDVLALNSTQQLYIEFTFDEQPLLVRPPPQQSATSSGAVVGTSTTLPPVVEKQPQRCIFPLPVKPCPLDNIGNTCYMNSLLQCLAYTPCIPPDPPAGSDAVVSLESLWRIIREMRTESPQIDELLLKRATAETTTPQLIQGGFNDVCELLGYILERVGKQLQGSFSVDRTYEILCPSGCKTTRNQLEHGLFLSAPEGDGTIGELIQKDSDAQVLPDAKCPVCNKIGGCSQSSRFNALPTILMLLIRRNANAATRNCAAVTLLERLNLVEEPSRSVEYSLYATINYDGISNSGGHYIAYCRDANDKKCWHCISDANVGTASLNGDVLSHAASRNITIAWYIRRDADLERAPASQASILEVPIQAPATTTTPPAAAAAASSTIQPHNVTVMLWKEGAPASNIGFLTDVDLNCTLESVRAKLADEVEDLPAEYRFLNPSNAPVALGKEKTFKLSICIRKDSNGDEHICIKAK